MPETRVIERVKCYFCHKRGYVDPNKPQVENGWYLEFFYNEKTGEDEEYHICDKCYHDGKIRCPSCGEEAQKLYTWVGPEGYDYEIHCYHCQSHF